MDRSRLVALCSAYKQTQAELSTPEAKQLIQARQEKAKKLKNLRDEILGLMKSMETSRITLGDETFDMVRRKKKPPAKRDVAEVLEIVCNVLNLSAETREALTEAVNNQLADIDENQETAYIESLVLKKPKTDATNLMLAAQVHLPDLLVQNNNAVSGSEEESREILEEMYP